MQVCVRAFSHQEVQDGSTLLSQCSEHIRQGAAIFREFFREQPAFYCRMSCGPRMVQNQFLAVEIGFYGKKLIVDVRNGLLYCHVFSISLPSNFVPDVYLLTSEALTDPSQLAQFFYQIWSTVQ